MNKLNVQQVRSRLTDDCHIPQSVVEDLYQAGYFHIWVPRYYGGLACSLEEGLKILREWASADGSLGWMLTLCSGANYFLRNLRPQAALSLLSAPRTILGGSGSIGGTAERKGAGYIIDGRWKYATGADHLSHFTLNAALVEDGKIRYDPDGKQVFRSFVVPADRVSVIEDWKYTGMKATGTYSFEVKQVFVPEEWSFRYDYFYDQTMAPVPFGIFADLTLLVNYLGLADHFLEEYRLLTGRADTHAEEERLETIAGRMYGYARDIQAQLDAGHIMDPEHEREVHEFGKRALDSLADTVVGLYRSAGLRAAEEQIPLQKVWNDFFTITQHAHFRKQ